MEVFLLIHKIAVYYTGLHCLLSALHTGRNGDPENEVNPETITVPPVYGEGEPLLEINIYETTEFRSVCSPYRHTV